MTNRTRCISVTSRSGSPAHGDDVRELAGLEAADVFFPVVVQHRRGVQIRGLQRLRGRHAPLHVVLELIGADAVRNDVRCGAAAEHDRHASAERALERSFRERDARGLAAGLAILVLLVQEIVERADEGQLLLEQQLHAGIIELEQMRRRIDARVQAAAHALAAIRVAGDLQAEPVRLVGDGVDFLGRERRRRDEAAVGHEQMVRPFEILRRVDLDPVDAVQLGFAHCGAREPRRVYVLAFGELGIEPLAAFIRVRVARPDVQRLTDHLHARPEHHARVYRIAQVDGVEAAARIHVGHGREARQQIGLRARERDVGAVGRRAPATIAARVHVHVRVDHARHHRSVAQVDDARVARDAHVRADLGDALAADQDRLARE